MTASLMAAMAQLTFSVDHATFTSTHQGIRMEGVQDASITRSSFSIPSPMVQGVVLGPTYGIYSDQCTGYRIQENSFQTTQPGAPYKVGLIIKDSGPAPNTFYNNTFDNLHAGSIIQGNNATAIDLIGLEVKCNDYGLALPNDFDVALTGGDVRVQRTQGQPLDQQDLTTYGNPAGNRFSLEHEVNPSNFDSESDWHVQVSGTVVEYFHHSPSPGNRTQPLYSDAPLEVIPTDEGAFWPGKQTACPSLLADDRTREERRQMAEAEDDELGNAKGAYDATKDNGDTYTLLGYVSDAAHSSAQVRNALQSVAPRVSAEVWIAAFERDTPMSAWHITQALLSNSPLQAEVLRMIQHYALLSAYADLVYAAQDGEVNVLTLLQSSMAKHAGRKAEAMADLGRMAWLDSLELGEQLDSLLLLHQQLPAWNSPLALSGVLAAKGAYATLEALAHQESQMDEVPELYALLKHYAQVQQAGGWTDEVASDVAWLQQLGAQREVIGSAHANAWLHALGEALPDEVIILPGSTPKAAAQGRHATPVAWPMGTMLEVYPNPAKLLAYVAYELEQSENPATLRLLDISGRSLHAQILPMSHGIASLDLYGLAAGLYVVKLSQAGCPERQAKLVVH